MKPIQYHQLQSIPLFAGIAPDDLPLLIECLNPAIRRYQKGDLVVAAGDVLRSIGIVLEGEVEVQHENAAGSKSLLAIVSQGDTFGEVAAFAGQRIWPSTVIARKDTQLMLLPPDRLLDYHPRDCRFHRQLIQNMLKIISDKALRLNRKLEYLEIKGIRQKLCTYLLEQRRLHGADTFILPMNKNELADYLHVSRPSMSRELGQLRDEKLLDFYLSSVRLLDVEQLRKIASA